MKLFKHKKTKKQIKGYIMASILILGVALSIISVAVFDYANNRRSVLELELYNRMADDASQSGVEDTLDKVEADPNYAGIEAPADCENTNTSLAPYIVEEELYCSTFSVEETEEGKFVSTGIVLRKYGDAFRQVSRHIFTANIPAGVGSSGGGTNGGPLNTFLNTSVAPPREGHAAVVVNDHAYVIGGCFPAYSRTSTVYFASISQNGSLGTWGSTASTPTASCNAAAAVYNGRIYVTGGNSTSAMYYATVNGDGSISGWTTVSTSKFANLIVHSMVAHNGYLYVIGGTNNGFTSPLNRISYAPINSATGAIGAWTDINGWFSASYQAQNNTSTVLNNRLYVVGRSGVRHAALNANGSVGAAVTTSHPVDRASPCVVVVNNTLYTMGGHSGGNLTHDDVHYSVIAAGGTPGAWTTTSPLLGRRTTGSCFTANRYIYYINGASDGGEPESNTWYSESN